MIGGMLVPCGPTALQREIDHAAKEEDGSQRLRGRERIGGGRQEPIVIAVERIMPCANESACSPQIRPFHEKVERAMRIGIRSGEIERFPFLINVVEVR